MLPNDEHEFLKRIRPHINDTIMFDILGLLKYYETRAIEKLIDCVDTDTKMYQGEVKSLKRIQAKLRNKEVEVK